jgi:hypothetical protein
MRQLECSAASLARSAFCRWTLKCEDIIRKAKFSSFPPESRRYFAFSSSFTLSNRIILIQIALFLSHASAPWFWDWGMFCLHIWYAMYPPINHSQIFYVITLINWDIYATVWADLFWIFESDRYAFKSSETGSLGGSNNPTRWQAKMGESMASKHTQSMTAIVMQII